MPIGSPSSAPIRFEPFEVDPQSGELRKQGVRVRLQEQPLQILQFLLERPGQVVTREQLQQRLWPADTFVDFDHGLYNAIKRLREALGDVADTPRFIETIPKRGYRFIGNVSRGEQSETSAFTANGGVPPASAASQTGLPPRKNWRAWMAGAASLLIIGLFIGLYVGGVGTRVRAAWTKPPQIHSLAVLPLKNLSDDPAQQYFSYGMTEELITDLAQISGLKVISHTSVLRYANTTKPLPQIAHELGVDGIVEGTMQRSGNRVRITAQLIYAPEEQHVWAASYDRELHDALGLQSSVAAAIVEPIRIRTGAVARISRKPPASPSLQALEDYLQGKYSVERMGAGEGYQGYEAAITHFKRAISEDPDFAASYVALANVYDAAYAWRPNEVIPLEKAALRKALELDPGSADAHLMSAAIKMNYDCDMPGAEREIKEALRLNPNLADAHDRFSTYLYSIGRRQESLQEAQRAQELDPAGLHALDPLMSEGQYDRAIEKLRGHLELHPNDGFAYIDPHGLIEAYHLAGKHQESIAALQQAWTLFGFKEIGQGVGKAYAHSGYAGALRYSAGRMERLYAEGKVYEPNMIALWYARAGDKEQALKWLRIELADNNDCWACLDRVPEFAFFRSDPRFQELVNRAPQH